MLRCWALAEVQAADWLVKLFDHLPTLAVVGDRRGSPVASLGELTALLQVAAAPVEPLGKSARSAAWSSESPLSLQGAPTWR